MSEKPINAEEVYVNKIEGSPGESTGGFHEDRPNANYNVSVQPATPSEPSAEQEARDMLERMGVENAQNWDAGWFVELTNLIDARAPLTVSEEAVRKIEALRDLSVYSEAPSAAYQVGWNGAVDAVLAVLRAGRSEGDGKP